MKYVLQLGQLTGPVFEGFLEFVSLWPIICFTLLLLAFFSMHLLNLTFRGVECSVDGVSEVVKDSADSDGREQEMFSNASAASLSLSSVVEFDVIAPVIATSIFFLFDTVCTVLFSCILLRFFVSLFCCRFFGGGLGLRRAAFSASVLGVTGMGSGLSSVGLPSIKCLKIYNVYL